MRIGTPEICEIEGRPALRAAVSSRLGESSLWYAVDTDSADALAADSSDAFLVGLLPIAMALEEDIQCEGPVSATLLFNIRHGYMRVLQTQIPRLAEITIQATPQERFSASTGVVATGISGGVDSSHVISDFHLEPDIPETMRVRQLLFFNVGSHGQKDRDKARTLFKLRHQRMQRAADFVGLPLLTVDSNLGEFYAAMEMNHLLTATVRNVSAAMSVQARVGRYLVASGPTWRRAKLAESVENEFTDPFSLPLCRTERFNAQSVGGELTRGEKLERIIRHDFAREFLLPCVRSHKNCGRCGKCLSTQLVLEALGVLPQFNRAFDLNIWNQVRESHIAEMRRKRHPVHVEFVEFVEKHAHPLSVGLRARTVQRLKELDALATDGMRRFRSRASLRVGLSARN